MITIIEMFVLISIIINNIVTINTNKKVFNTHNHCFSYQNKLTQLEFF